MMKELKRLVGVAGILAVVIFISSCGETAKLAEISPDDSTSYVNEAMEMLDPADLLDFYGLSPDLQQNPSLSPLAVSAPAEDPGKVLIFLNPNRIRMRKHLLRAIEAPLYVAWYFGALLRVGDTSCLAEVTGLDQCRYLADGECTFTYSTTATGCVKPVFVRGSTHTITITGDLSVTVRAVEGGVEFEVVASDLKVEGDEGRYLIYNGTVTKTITFDQDSLGHTAVLRTTDLRVEDSSGAVGTASGTRTVEVRYGEWLRAQSEGVLTYTPPEGETVVIEVNILREVTFEDSAKTIHLEETIVTDGVTRRRTMDLTIERITDEEGIPVEIVVSGSASFSGPRGDVNISLDEVVISAVCPHRPMGGSITVEGRNHVITVTFSQECSCEVTVVIDGGDPQSADVCGWNEFQRRR